MIPMSFFVPPVFPVKFLLTTEPVKKFKKFLAELKKLTTSAEVCKCLLGCCCCICDCVVLFCAMACPDWIFGILRPVKYQTILMGRLIKHECKILFSLHIYTIHICIFTVFTYLFLQSKITQIDTTWKVSKYRVSSSPYLETFHAVRLTNTVIQ